VCTLGLISRTLDVVVDAYSRYFIFCRGPTGPSQYGRNGQCTAFKPECEGAETLQPGLKDADHALGLTNLSDMAVDLRGSRLSVVPRGLTPLFSRSRCLATVRPPDKRKKLGSRDPRKKPPQLYIWRRQNGPAKAHTSDMLRMECRRNIQHTAAAVAVAAKPERANKNIDSMRIFPGTLSVQERQNSSAIRRSFTRA
jgi:hypothetical protein